MNNIPLYNDEKLNKEISNRKKQENYNKKKEKDEKEKQYKKQLKLNRFKISEIPLTMLISIYFMISIIGISLYTSSIEYVFYSIIGILLNIYIGKRLNFKFDDNLNILIWNITQSFEDFLQYKLKLDFISGTNIRFTILTTLFSISLLLLKSSNLFFGMLLFATIINYLIAFSYRQLDKIASSSSIISFVAVLGLISKTILYSLIYNKLTIDFINIIIVILFSIIAYYTTNLPIYEPQE